MGPEGESPADVYDRDSAFLETLYRMWQQKREDSYVVVSHGTMILIFLQRFFGMTVQEFYTLAELENTEFVVMEKTADYWYEHVYSYRSDRPRHIGLRTVPQDSIRPQTTWSGKDTL